MCFSGFPGVSKSDYFGDLFNLFSLKKKHFFKTLFGKYFLDALTSEVSNGGTVPTIFKLLIKPNLYRYPHLEINRIPILPDF